MAQLRRQLGVVETTSLALGAMIGAGVYVSMGEAAGTTGGSLLVAVLIGAGVALLNGLSSVELAVDDPRAGGAYVFASRLVSPVVGFLAGWIFLFAALTAGATFALTFAAYLGPLFPGVPPKAIGLALTVAAALLNSAGVRPAARANTVLVIVNIAVLVVFVLLTLPLLELARLRPFLTGGVRGLGQASALLFFAYTGYARPVTVAEEVRDPAVTLPRAVATAIGLTTILYFGVALAALGVLEPARLGQAEAPLRAAVQERGGTVGPLLLSLGALIATATVLVTEIWGLSRLALAMGRDGSLPGWFARVDAAKRIPRNAVVAASLALVLLAGFLDLRAALEASSLALLGYYWIMNLSALRLPGTARRYSRAIPLAGLLATSLIAVTLPARTLLLLLVVILLGLGYYAWKRRSAPQRREAEGL